MTHFLTRKREKKREKKRKKEGKRGESKKREEIVEVKVNLLRNVQSKDLFQKKKQKNDLRNFLEVSQKKKLKLKT